MIELARYLLFASGLLLTLALVVDVVVVATRRHGVANTTVSRVPVGVGAGPGHPETVPATPAAHPSHGMSWFGTRLVQLSLVFLTIALALRTWEVGHAPFANQYEFAISFAWGVIAAYVYFEWRYRVQALSLAVLPVALAMLLYASTVSDEANPLVPALQNHLLLTLHVITAVLAYGAAAVAFAAAVLYLVRPMLARHFHNLPSEEVLDELGYRSVVLSFPLMTVMILLGAIWADIAWGRYWSWDPKETSALVTWLIYGAYLHARVVADWRGRRAAYLLILGFLAVLFTYFGNLFFGGLHSYA